MTTRARLRTSPIPTLRLRSPQDVLAAIPYLVGYHPTQSLVVIGMRDRRVNVTMRNDLPAESDSDEQVGPVIAALVAFLHRECISEVVMVGYGPDTRVAPVLQRLLAACAGTGIAVVEALQTDGTRFRSYLCHDPSCCPPDGTPYDLTEGTVAAEATLAGRVALADRSSYEEQIAPITGAGREAMTVALARAQRRLADVLDGERAETGLARVLVAGRAAVNAAVDRQRGGGRLSDDETAWLSVLLTSRRVRDYAWRRIGRPGHPTELHRALWMDVLRRADPAMLAAPGALYAFAAWRCGDSALAALALDRVLRQHPQDWLANALAMALERGLPPSVLTNWPGRVSSSRSRRRPRRR